MNVLLLYLIHIAIKILNYVKKHSLIRRGMFMNLVNNSEFPQSEIQKHVKIYSPEFTVGPIKYKKRKETAAIFPLS